MLSQGKRSLLKTACMLSLYLILISVVRHVARSSQPRLQALLPEVPSFSLDYGTPAQYNVSKVALLIENRPMGTLAPLIVHMISVLPHDWRFRFMGSVESVQKVNNSAAVRRHVRNGKLDLTYIPSNMTVAGQEQISNFLTDLWVNEILLQPAEWLLLYQSDSVMCSKAPGSLDDWLEYDWVGAPWYGTSRYGGNGGLSLRRVSSMVSVFKHQQRIGHSEPEDVWITERLGHLPNARTANGSESMKFSVESIWYDRPLGYHTGGSGAWLMGGVWGKPNQRNHIYEYCPEMKITLDMDIKHSMPNVCHQEW